MFLNDKANTLTEGCAKSPEGSPVLSSPETSNNVPFLLLQMETGQRSVRGSMGRIYRTASYIRML